MVVLTTFTLTPESYKDRANASSHRPPLHKGDQAVYPGGVALGGTELEEDVIYSMN